MGEGRSFGKSKGIQNCKGHSNGPSSWVKGQCGDTSRGWVFITQSCIQKPLKWHHGGARNWRGTPRVPSGPTPFILWPRTRRGFESPETGHNSEPLFTNSQRSEHLSRAQSLSQTYSVSKVDGEFIPIATLRVLPQEKLLFPSLWTGLGLREPMTLAKHLITCPRGFSVIIQAMFPHRFHT